MKKIAVGDLGEFWYGDYKEPFVQLEGAVPGYPQGVLLEDDEGKLLCAYCGRTYDCLASHTTRAHGLTARDYKREVGLLQKSSLTSERSRLAMSAPALRRYHRDSATHGFRDGHRYSSVGPRIVDPTIGRGARTPEKLNRTGRCYAQLLAVGRAVIADHGRLSHVRLAKRGVSRHAWRPFFATIEDYARAAGGRSSMQYWTNEELVTALRGLGQSLGRTPSESDLRRYGLPWAPTFRKHFGTYPEACRRAGLIPNLPVPYNGDREVQILTAYATTGSVNRVTAIVHGSPEMVSRILIKYGVPMVKGAAPHVERRAAREWAAEVARRLSDWPSEPAA